MLPTNLLISATPGVVAAANSISLQNYQYGSNLRIQLPATATAADSVSFYGANIPNATSLAQVDGPLGAIIPAPGETGQQPSTLVQANYLYLYAVRQNAGGAALTAVVAGQGDAAASGGGSTAYLNLTALAVPNTIASGNIGNPVLSAAASVDVYSAFDLTQTTPNLVLTLASPTGATTAHVALVQNVGTVGFVMYGVPVQPGAQVMVVWNGTAWVTASPPANIAPLSLGNFAAGGSIGTAPATVDQFSTIEIAQSNVGQALTLPNPTSTAVSRAVRVVNTGGATFAMLGVPIGPNLSAQFIWDPTVFAWATSEAMNANVAPRPLVAIGDQAGGGLIGTAASTVDIARLINLGQTTTGQTMTMPNPTAGTGEVMVSNTGTAPFVMYGVAIMPGQSVRYVYTVANAAWVAEQPQVQSSSSSKAALVANVAGGGSIGVATGNVDIATLIQVNQTTVNQALTLPNPTQASQARLVSVANVGTAAFYMLGQVVAPGAAITAQWDAVNAAWRGTLDVPTLVQTATKTLAYTPVFGEIVPLDVATTGAIAITLPVGTSANKGQLVVLNVIATSTGANVATRNVTVTAGAAQTLEGLAAGQTVTITGKSRMMLEFDGTSNWSIVSQPSSPSVNAILTGAGIAVTVQRQGVVTQQTCNTLGADRVITLGTTNAQQGDIYWITRDNSAFQLTVANGGGGGGNVGSALVASKYGFVQALFNGTDWVLLSISAQT